MTKPDTRDIVERLSPRLTPEAREEITDLIAAGEAFADEDEDGETAALTIMLAVYDAAPAALAEIETLRARVAALEALLAGKGAKA